MERGIDLSAIETQSKTSIISKALILCGENEVTSLTDNRYGVRVSNQLFEMLFEEELQSNPWRFAQKNVALSRLTSVPLDRWQFAYQLPSDMLLPRGMWPAMPYEIYGTHLYTNAAVVNFEYTFKPDVSKCPAYFSTLMSARLCSMFIKPLTESDAAWQIAVKVYNMQRGRAMYADAQGRPAQTILDSPFTDNR